MSNFERYVQERARAELAEKRCAETALYVKQMQMGLELIIEASRQPEMRRIAHELLAARSPATEA